MTLYESTTFLVPDHIRESHTWGWENIAKTGPFWRGVDRVAIAQEVLNSLSCGPCANRKTALSRKAVNGDHDTSTHLTSEVVDFIYSLTCDAARVTKSDFDRAIASGLSHEQYVEMVSVICSTVIIESMHRAVESPIAVLPEGDKTEPVGQPATEVVDDGAWLPISPSDPEQTIYGIPRTANILRSMGCVPAAVDHFFRVFRSHYMLTNVPVQINRMQVELTATAVSAQNECFY